MSWILAYLCLVTVFLSSTSKTYVKNVQTCLVGIRHWHMPYANLLHESNKYKYYKQLFTKRLENKDIRCIHFRVQNGSPGSTRFYGPVHLRRYWSVPVSTGPYILGRPVKFSNSQDADNLHTIRKRMPIPFQ